MAERTQDVRVDKILNMIFKIWEYSIIFPVFVYRKRIGFIPLKRNFLRILIPIFCLLLGYIKIWKFQGRIAVVDNSICYAYTVAKMCLCLLNVLLTHKNKNKISTLLDDLNEISATLQKHDMDTGMHNLMKVCLCFVGILVHHVLSIILDIYLIIRDGHAPLISAIGTNNSDFFDYEIVILYYFLSFILWSYTNSFLQHIRSNFSILQNNNSLRILLRVHCTISTCSRHFADSFKDYILLRLTYNAMSLLFGIYFDMFIKSDVRFDMPIISWMAQVSWMLWYLGGNLIVIYFNAAIRSRTKLAIQYMQSIQMGIGKENLSYKQMENFLLKMKLNDVKSNVCGFFPLDWSLLHSMVAGIATYLVYLIQFREIELDKKNTQAIVQ